MKKILLVINFLFSVLVLAQPGTLDTSFNPSDLGFDVVSNEVKNTKVQSDGKIVIVGSFSLYNGISRNRIARINTDGTLDLTFNPGTGADATIQTLSIQSDGKIVIVGSFSLYNGVSRNRIARINTDGTLDLTFNPGTGADPTIQTLSIQSDGKIIIGGNFTLFNGISRNSIARLNTDGSADTSFNSGTGFTGDIFSISLQTDGKIIIGGLFTSYNGITSKNIARINSNGTLDTTFITGTGANGNVYTTSIQSDGKVIIGGSFTTYNGTPSNFLNRLNTDGTLDTSFNIGTGTNGTIRTTSIQSNGKIIIGGTFTTCNGVSRNYIARINSDGTLDNSFDAERGLLDNAGGTYVGCISILNDGKLLLTGNFSFVNGVWRRYMAVLGSTGLLTDIFKGNGVQGGIVHIAKKYGADKVIIGGTFYSYNGTRRRGIAMLNLDGSLDLSFNAVLGVTNGVSGVLDIEVVGDKIIIVGSFTTYNGLSANRIIRLNSNGSLDASFNTGTGPNSVINTITSIGNNKFLIGGNFTTYNGTSINKIAKINFDGSLDNTFTPNNIGNIGTINTIEIANRTFFERYVVGGNFSVNGTSNVLICEFSSTGGVGGTHVGTSGDIVNVVLNDGAKINYATNSSFNQVNIDSNIFPSGMISINGPIYSMSKQSDGKIIIGGDFTTYNGVSSNYVARLNTDGTLDTTFNIGIGANGIVRTTSIQSDGKIIIGGDFTAYNGIGRNRIARINNTAALSNNRFKKNILNIFPNPSSGYFTLQIDNLIEMKTVEVYTIIGQKIYSKQLTENESTLDLSNQPKGVYIYKILGSNKEMESGKLVID